MDADLLCELGEDVNEQGLPPGFRFHPTDEELITFYLSSKVFNPSSSSTFTNNSIVPRITEVDLNRCEPWDLPESARTGDREWYLFSLRDRKYPTGLRTNRATGAGYWKATGKDKEVYSSANNNGGIMIGMKKTLVFYKGRAPRGDKTRWVMHEFRLDGHLISSSRQFTEEWVICRVYHKIGEKTKNPTTALLRGGGQSNYLWPWGDMNHHHHNTPLMDAITITTSSANPTPLFHHPQTQEQTQEQQDQDQEQEERFLHLNKLIRTLNPVLLPDHPFSMPVLMNNNNNDDRIQLLPATAACHNNRIVDRQTNNCMSHQQDLLHHHQAASISTTVPKQLLMKTEETISGQLMMIHPPNDPYYHQQQQLYHENIIDFRFSSSINDVTLTKNCPHFI